MEWRRFGGRAVDGFLRRCVCGYFPKSSAADLKSVSMMQLLVRLRALGVFKHVGDIGPMGSLGRVCGACAGSLTQGRAVCS